MVKKKTKKSLHDYFMIAGGPTKVSRLFGVSRRTLYRWSDRGLPDSEYSGRTDYTAQLSQLCAAMNHKVTAKHLLEVGRP